MAGNIRLLQAQVAVQPKLFCCSPCLKPFTLLVVLQDFKWLRGRLALLESIMCIICKAPTAPSPSAREVRAVPIHVSASSVCKQPQAQLDQP